MSHSLSYFFSISPPKNATSTPSFLLRPFFSSIIYTVSGADASVVLLRCRSDPCGDTRKRKDFDFWVLFFGALGHWKSGEIVVGVMGSNGSKATSSYLSSSSSSSSGSLRKGRSKGLKVFQSCCLGTTSGSQDSDNEDQVTYHCLLLAFALLLYFFFLPCFYFFSFFACVSSSFTCFKLLTDMLEAIWIFGL